MEYLHSSNVLFSLRRYFRWQNFAEMAWCMSFKKTKKKQTKALSFLQSHWKKGLNDKNFFFSSVLLLAANTELALWQCCSVLHSETSDRKRVSLDEIRGRSSALWGWTGSCERLWMPGSVLSQAGWGPEQPGRRPNSWHRNLRSSKVPPNPLNEYTHSGSNHHAKRPENSKESNTATFSQCATENILTLRVIIEN